MINVRSKDYNHYIYVPGKIHISFGANVSIFWFLIITNSNSTGIENKAFAHSFLINEYSIYF
jgi:hypothetical protein